MLNIKTLCPSDLPICKTLFYGDITLGQHGATNSNNQFIHISLSRYVALQNQRNTDRKPHHLTYSERKYSGQNVITANLAMEIVKAFFNELFPIWAFKKCLQFTNRLELVLRCPNRSSPLLGTPDPAAYIFLV